MLHNLLFATVLIGTTVFVHMIGLMAVSNGASRLAGMLPLDRRHTHMLAMALAALGIFGVLGAQIWIWTAAYLALGIFPDIESALYFSIATFCTLGYGDIVPPVGWRVFSALEGVNGFLLIGWSTAYLIALGIRIGPFGAGELF